MGRKSQHKSRGGEVDLSKIFQNYGYHVNFVNLGKLLKYSKEPDVVNLKGIHSEIRGTEQVHLTDWIAQAVRDAEKFGDCSSGGVSPEEQSGMAMQHEFIRIYYIIWRVCMMFQL